MSSPHHVEHHCTLFMSRATPLVPKAGRVFKVERLMNIFPVLLRQTEEHYTVTDI